MRNLESNFYLISTKPDLSDFAGLMSENRDLAYKICREAGKDAKAGTLCAIFHYAQMFGEDMALNFAKQLRTGENLTMNDPAYRLRERLAKIRVSGSKGQSEDYAFAVTACLAHAKNEKIYSFRPAKKW